EGAVKRFGAVEALRCVDLDLNRGEVLALVGDNGAGKSTLIKAIAGVYQVDAGTVRLDGETVHFHTPRDARRAGIETIYQDLALADQLDVGANIFLGREPVRRLLGLIPIIDKRKIKAEIGDLLKRIESHIPDVDAVVRDLSGGQRQAVSIARALFWKARVVIMDEPTAALAVMETRNVQHMARQLAQEGVGVLYIGHNLIEILDIADRILVMHRGKMVFEAAAADTNQDELIKYMTGFSELSGRAAEDGRADELGKGQSI
ncbi:MAG: ATP-binding cassette domain-containing protein, partial [Deinococcales bacterium]